MGDDIFNKLNKGINAFGHLINDFICLSSNNIDGSLLVFKPIHGGFI